MANGAVGQRVPDDPTSAAVSAPIRDSLVRWGNGVDRVTLVENGVDVPTPNADARERVRAALGLTSRQHLVLVVGRLDRGKGVAEVVHAVGRLLEAGHDIVLAVAGEGEEGKRLTQLTESLGIGGRVHLLGYRSDVGDLLVATDVFVIASYSEGLPIALIEAMALERPVVATRVGEIANALEGESGGLLLDPGDIDALGAAIESVVTRPDEAQQRVTAALRRYGALLEGSDGATLSGVVRDIVLTACERVHSSGSRSDTSARRPASRTFRATALPLRNAAAHIDFVTCSWTTVRVAVAKRCLYCSSPIRKSN